MERALLEAKLYMHPYRWEREGGIAIFDSKLIGQVAMEEVNDELET